MIIDFSPTVFCYFIVWFVGQLGPYQESQATQDTTLSQERFNSVISPDLQLT